MTKDTASAMNSGKWAPNNCYCLCVSVLFVGLREFPVLTTEEMDVEVKTATDTFVEVDRKISLLEWFMILTGPFVMPLFAPFILLWGVKTYLAKKRKQRIRALNDKAMLVGLGQWAYRVSCTFACFGLLLFTMIKTGRFGWENEERLKPEVFHAEFILTRDINTWYTLKTGEAVAWCKLLDMFFMMLKLLLLLKIMYLMCDFLYLKPEMKNMGLFVRFKRLVETW